MPKGPTRTQSPGKPSEHVRTIKKLSREADPHKGKKRGGFHSPKKREYIRKEKHKGQSDQSVGLPEDEMISTPLTPIDETYRMIKFPIAELNWSTHKSETFDDTGEKGLHPAWGLKSIIDRGVKTHEKPDGDKNIGAADHQTTKRDIDSKSFKSYSMIQAFSWS